MFYDYVGQLISRVFGTTRNSPKFQRVRLHSTGLAIWFDELEQVTACQIEHSEFPLQFDPIQQKRHIQSNLKSAFP